ncbi:MAG: DNA topoisomerase VI subunit B [Candidatus Micrarchaeia archaeon]
MEKETSEIFKEFREHSIAEFFKKNRQMLGYSSKVRSMTTIVHEYVTNSLDACEEKGILPDISVEIKEIENERYHISVKDNGPGIPKEYVGRALAEILAGTKFHRYLQQRGQQGIGAAGCTLFSQITTGKPIHIKSSTSGGNVYECDLSIDIMKNLPVMANYKEYSEDFEGIEIRGEFAEVKYENSDHGVYEYLRRSALANPHAQISLLAPDGSRISFMRATNELPKRPKEAKLHPLGLSVNDLLDYAKASTNRKISGFLEEAFARVTPAKIEEIAHISGIDMSKDPKEISWEDAKKIINAIKQIKWISPDSTSIVPIGEKQIKNAMQNIINPEFMNIKERKPAIFRGGIPFIVEAGIAYGGSSINKDSNTGGVILRFANRVPLMFDSNSCAITEAVRAIQWKRYNIDLENDPVSIFVNVSSAFIPYSGVGKEAIAQEPEIIEEIKLTLMEAARGLQRYVAGKRDLNYEIGRYKTIMRYVNQLATDLSSITGRDKSEIENQIKEVVRVHYPRITEAEDKKQGN